MNIKTVGMHCNFQIEPSNLILRHGIVKNIIQILTHKAVSLCCAKT
jgi:hypothetical protein